MKSYHVPKVQSSFPKKIQLGIQKDNMGRLVIERRPSSKHSLEKQREDVTVSI